jgi:hypothetical protein
MEQYSASACPAAAKQRQAIDREGTAGQQFFHRSAAIALRMATLATAAVSVCRTSTNQPRPTPPSYYCSSKN